MHVTAIIAAAGQGARFGGGEPKQFLVVGGRPMLERSVDLFLTHAAVDEVIVALPVGRSETPPSYLRGTSKPLKVVEGGMRRQDSVANAFRAAPASSDVIVIHDAARPFASADLISRTITAAAASGAAVAAIQARDTVKQTQLVLRQAEDERKPASLTLSSSKGERLVTATLPRETIYLAQTPQAFRRDVLVDALRMADEATDEATLAERAGHRVAIVEGEVTNIKITTAEDLAIADVIARSADARVKENTYVVSGFSRREEILPKADATRDVLTAGEPPAPARTGRAGTGYDLHRLVAGRPLMLGGVVIPSDRGAVGHSDADVVCHAVTDAILGAACLGDIGRHFPDSDPRWKGASSLDLLARAVKLVRDAGLEVGNVDVTVVLEAPKIRDHIDAMRAAVARAIGVGADRVSIKGKTNEGMDAIGRGEAIAAQAIALVRSR